MIKVIIYYLFIALHYQLTLYNQLITLYNFSIIGKNNLSLMELILYFTIISIPVFIYFIVLIYILNALTYLLLFILYLPYL
jgi:hypothetical protein